MLSDSKFAASKTYKHRNHESSHPNELRVSKRAVDGIHAIVEIPFEDIGLQGFH
jgi:hypothetical protein